jgi:uncharacterized surface protein with fasciclin (FAS1) repeats
MTKQFLSTTLLFAAISAAACAPAYTMRSTPPTKNIVEIATENGNFKTLVAAVQKAGLTETLESAGPFTVFAPTDAAFANVPTGTLNALIANKEKLAAVLTYHVVSGKVVAADITRMNGATPTTVNGQLLDITVSDGRVYVNNALVTTADIQASNGIIHVINAVLMPRPVAAMSGR